MKTKRSNDNVYTVRLSGLDNDQFASYLERTGRPVNRVLKQLISDFVTQNIKECEDCNHD